MDKMPITEIPLHGKYGRGKVALVDGDYDGEYLAGFDWRVTPKGYVYRSERVMRGSRTVQGIIYMHHMVHGQGNGDRWVEHIDGDKLNNRSCNLRWRTPSEACKSRRQRKFVTTKRYRGVSKSGTLYWVTFRGKYIDSFKLARAAAKRYDELARAEYGDRAVLNFPIDKS